MFVCLAYTVLLCAITFYLQREEEEARRAAEEEERRKKKAEEEGSDAEEDENEEAKEGEDKSKAEAVAESKEGEDEEGKDDEEEVEEIDTSQGKVLFGYYSDASPDTFILSVVSFLVNRFDFSCLFYALMLSVHFMFQLEFIYLIFL